jgi:hypothetical protein
VAAPRQPWRTAHKAGDGDGTERLSCKKEKKEVVPHIAVMLRVERTGTVRQWRRRSMLAILAQAVADLWCGLIRRRGRTVLGHELELE